MENPLKPCPFCGYQTIYVRSSKNRTAASGRMFFCRCTVCHAKGSRSNVSEAEAIEKWNNRPPAQSDN